MKRRPRAWLGLLCVALAMAGCHDGPPDAPPPGGTTLPRANGLSSDSGTSSPAVATAHSRERKAIIESVVQLIQDAALRPGSENFAIATDNLNHYFEGTDPAAFAMSPGARDYLGPRLTARVVKALEVPKFTRADARHIEDCLLYQAIAKRAAGEGDDLERVRRLFDWVVEQVQLVPPEALAPPATGQSQAESRPYDVLIRGMATERGTWAERSWVFMVLCRQLGIDVGLVTYTPRGQREAVVWICAAIIDKKPYLFDARIGLAVPGPGGKGVATLEEAATIPEVLDRLDLPGESPYGTTRTDLAAGKLGILIDSSLEPLSPRVRLLQERLTGKNRMVLFRDPAEQRAAFVEALGDRLGAVELWPLPIEVETRLFTDGRFNKAAQFPIRLFIPQLPLLSARLAQLRGDLPAATQAYVSFRFAKHATLRDKKTLIPPDLQHDLDMYATYFLALCHLDQGHPDQAEFLFQQSLRLLPEPKPGFPYYPMYRWGAQTNLGRLSEAKNDPRRAIQYYGLADPTPQHHGNLLRARALIWRDPTGPAPAAPVPTASTAPVTP